MEVFYFADSERLNIEDIKTLNSDLFAGWDDGDMPFNDSDILPEHMHIITDEEFINGELNNDLF